MSETRQFLPLFSTRPQEASTTYNKQVYLFTRILLGRDFFLLVIIEFKVKVRIWLQIPVQQGDIDLHPGHIVQSYVRTVAQFGPMIEVRSGMRYALIRTYITFWVKRDGIIRSGNMWLWFGKAYVFSNKCNLLRCYGDRSLNAEVDYSQKLVID